MHRARPASAAVRVLGAAALTGLTALVAGCGAGTEVPSSSPATVVPTPATVQVPAVPTPPSVPASGPSAPEPVADATPAEPCTGPGLAVSVGAPATADGVVTQALFFQNTGTAPCLLRGFPAVSFVAGNEGTRIGLQALPVGERGGDVRLAPREAAVVPLRITRTAGYDAAVCRPVPVRGLRVAPPGGSGSVFVPREDTACSAATLTEPQMQVGTVTRR